MTPETRRRAARPRRLRGLILAGVAGLVIVLVAVAAAAFLSDISMRRLLGTEALAVTCDEGSADIRFPLGGRGNATWDAGPSLPRAQDEVRALAVGDRILLGTGITPRRGVVGGFASLGLMYSYDPVSETYRRIAPLPVPLDHQAVAALGDEIYMISGWSDGIPSDHVFRLEDGKWAELPPIPTPRAGAAAAVVGRRIFVVGGTTARHDASSLAGVSTVEAFDIDTNRWLRLPDMPTPRHHHAAVSLGSVITVLGGRDGDLFSLATVEQFDTATGRWTERRPLPLASGALSAVVVGRTMVVAGGGDDGEGWVTPATWTMRGGEWRRLPDLRVPRHGHGMAALDGVVFVFGGSPCAGYGATGTVERLVVRARQ